MTWGDGQRGTNRVEAILGGRVIRERFDGRPGADFQGTSLSVHSAALDGWRQTWADSDGNYGAFSGGLAEGRLTLAADDVIRNIGKRAIPQFVIDGKWVQPYRPGKGFLYEEMSQLLGLPER